VTGFIKWEETRVEVSQMRDLNGEAVLLVSDAVDWDAHHFGLLDRLTRHLAELAFGVKHQHVFVF
jgi:hypothetical protein